MSDITPTMPRRKTWHPMETLPDNDWVIAKKEDGTEMEWHSPMLRAAMSPSLSVHLQFQAVRWRLSSRRIPMEGKIS